MYENFETLPLSLALTGTWERSTISPHSGNYCFKSAAIGDATSSTTTTTITAGSAGAYISFYARVSSDNMSGTDRFNFVVDDSPYYSGIMGEVPWTEFTCTVGPGEHTLKWEYVKDGSISAGEDAVYIDDIHIFDLMTVDFRTDTKRKIVTSYTADSINIDTKRIVIYNAASFNAETKRIIHSAIALDTDTKRIVNGMAEFEVDTKRRFVSELSGIKSISIDLMAKTLSDTFTLETTKPLDIQNTIIGTVLNYNFQFLVESTSQKDDVQRITGMYDVDLLLCTPIVYTTPTTAGAAKHTEVIAAALGKACHIAIDDFTPSTTLASVGATYKNLIASLFGWTSSLPQRQINAFLRGNTLYAIQRGHESGTIEIKSPYTRPTITRKIIRSMWAGSGSSSIASSVVIAPIPFSGTIGFGDQRASYSGGLLVSESHAGTTTSYSYSGQYLTHKSTIGDKIRVKTDYDYGGTGNDYVLAVETETTTNFDDSGSPTSTTVRVTRHVPIGRGWWGTTVEVDKEPAGSSMSKGKPGGKASLYCVDESNRSLGSSYSNPSGTTLPGPALIDTDFPVSDLATLIKLTDAVKWLNGKTEEHVQMDIYEQSVIDFTKTITFNGNIYHLEKNTIKQDSRETKQSIDIVRWY